MWNPKWCGPSTGQWYGTNWRVIDEYTFKFQPTHWMPLAMNYCERGAQAERDAVLRWLRIVAVQLHALANDAPDRSKRKRELRSRAEELELAADAIARGDHVTQDKAPDARLKLVDHHGE